MALANPLLDFDDLLFVKRVPGSFTHMSDQYYGWFSRPGGGVFVLEDFKSDQPHLRCLTAAFPPGTFLRPDLSHDGTRVLFAYCKYYPGLNDEPNKLDKNNVPEDAFFHLYEMNLDGSGVRRLTHGKYDDFDGRYLPNGEIVFLSTRRGQYIQCGRNRATPAATAPARLLRPLRRRARAAGGRVHAARDDADGGNIRQISPFEMFEWTPSIDNDGRILYARWDYVDRYNMPYMSLWSTLPDGSNAQAIFGNYTLNPHCVFEARRIPDSRKMIFTASGHHAFTGGCLVLLDAHRAADGEAAMTRLTPEVCFPESEGWPQTYFGSPYPVVREPLPDRVERAAAAARYAAARLGHARAGQRPGPVPVRCLRQLELDLPRSGDRQRDAVADPAARARTAGPPAGCRAGCAARAAWSWRTSTRDCPTYRAARSASCGWSACRSRRIPR